MKIKRKNNSGFTLVELLAVIVIMGILMMVAIPSVTRTIENSRKDTFVDIAKSYGNAARTLWTSDNLTCNGVVSSAVDDGDYYILINSKEGAKDSLPVLVDQGGKSSWGNRDVNGYVRVNVSTTPGVDNNGDGTFEIEPKRVTKFYVALSDGTHGLVDDDTLMMDELKRGNVVMVLSGEQLKKTELTVEDGRLDCARDVNGEISCTAVTPIKDITGVCVDDQTNVAVTGRVEMIGTNFSTDSWSTVVQALKSGSHPYHVGDTKNVDMGSFGTHTIRIANLSTCDGSVSSETACGVVLEFTDGITTYQMNNTNTNNGSWPATVMRAYLNNDIYNSLPSDLKNGIIDTNVVSGAGNAFLNSYSNYNSTDKLYLLAITEVYEVDSRDSIFYGTEAKDTRQLDYYKEKGTTISNKIAAKKTNGASLAYIWWLRTPDAYMSNTFQYVFTDGSLGGDYASAMHYISPAFRLA